MDNALREYYLRRRAEWSPEQRARNARSAASLPDGRAWHLVDRFMELTVGGMLIYQGKGDRCVVLKLAYATVAHEQPDLIPAADKLAWVAELADEAAVDVALVEVDRAARQLLEDREQARERIERMLAAPPTKGRSEHAYRQREQQRQLAWEWEHLHRPFFDSEGYEHVIVPWPAARQTLDALLVEGTGAFAPGSRVRLLAGAGEHAGKPATIQEARWAWDAEGEARALPVGYVVHPDRTIPDVDVPAAAVEDLLEQDQAEGQR